MNRHCDSMNSDIFLNRALPVAIRITTFYSSTAKLVILSQAEVQSELTLLIPDCNHCVF